MKQRWRLEIKIDGQWYVKTFWTGIGARLYQQLIRWTCDRYTLALYKEPRKP